MAMQINRVVTGHGDDGKSVFLERGAPKTAVFKHVPGFAVATVWGTGHTPAVPHKDGAEATHLHSLVPGTGETRLLIVDFPPDSVMASITDWEAVGAEYAANLPGLAEKFEPDHPGMHTTDTVDYGILLSGELTLELDDNKSKSLKPGDVVVQNGTRHAWRNTSGAPARIVFVLIGAKAERPRS